jgi:hypothetical protein
MRFQRSNQPVGIPLLLASALFISRCRIDSHRKTH